MVFASIYKQIVRDFAFLHDHGYDYSHDIQHFVAPSVLFKNFDKSIRIGFNYETRKMLIVWYRNHGTKFEYTADLSEPFEWQGKTYKAQLEDAKRLVERFLSDDPTVDYLCIKVKGVTHDEASGEADILVSDGERELLCYCPLCRVQCPSDVDEITAFAADGMMIADEPGCVIEKTDAGYFAYRLGGKVVKTEPPTVAIGGLRVKLDQPLPKDIKRGDFVVFTADRLDCSVSVPDELYRYVKTEYPRFTDVRVDSNHLEIRLHDDLMMEIDLWSKVFFNGRLYYVLDEQDIKDFVGGFLSGEDVLCVVKKWRGTRLEMFSTEEFKDSPRVVRAWTATEKIK